jgi:hypothetical protein
MAMDTITLAFLSGAAPLVLYLAEMPASAQQAGPHRRQALRSSTSTRVGRKKDREWYYHFSQGSAAIHYDIFLNLEVAGSQELFARMRIASASA